MSVPTRFYNLKSPKILKYMKRMIDVCVGSITLRELDQELYNGKANNDNSLSI